MVAYAKNWSCYCHYRFGTRPFEGHYDIYQHQNFQIANALFQDGLMFRGYPPKDTLSLVVILEKEGSLSANKKVLERGEILILDDSDEYEIAFSCSMQEGVLSLKKGFVNTYFPYLNRMVNRVYSDTNSLLRELITDLKNKNEYIDDEIQSRLIKNLKSLSFEKQKEIPKKLSSKEALIFEVRDHILEHIRENIQIEELALIFGMSEKTMQTGFKKLLGHTPKKFIKLLKLNLAHQEIIENDQAKTISEIAMKYGFGNFGLFSKEYKAVYGFLPSQNPVGENKLS